MSTLVSKFKRRAGSLWSSSSETFLGVGDTVANATIKGFNGLCDWVYARDQDIVKFVKSSANDIYLNLPQSPSDPAIYTAEGLSYSISRTFQGANFLRKNYPAKTFGVLALPGSTTMMMQGIETGNIPLTIAGGTFATTNTMLVLFADQTRSIDDVDPQDIRSGPEFLYRPDKYPHEFISTWGTCVGLTSQVLSGSGDNIEYAVMGAIGVPAWLISTFVREKESKKDIEFFEDPIEFTQTKPIRVAGSLYLSSTQALLGTEIWQTLSNVSKETGFQITDIEQVSAALTNINPSVLQAWGSYTVAGLFYMWAQKRKRITDDGAPPGNLENPDNPLNQSTPMLI